MATATAPSPRSTPGLLPRPAVFPVIITALAALVAIAGMTFGSIVTDGSEAPRTAGPSAAPVAIPALPPGTVLDLEGNLERTVSHQPRRVTATGWAVGGPIGESLRIEFSSQGQLLDSVAPNTPRPEVGQRHPGTGLDHGFNHTFPIVPGRHLICATAVTAAGERLELGCDVADVAR